MDLIVTVLCVVLVSIVTTWSDAFSPGSVGVSLVMVVGFNETLGRLIVTWTKLESSVGAVARCKQFITQTEREDDIAPFKTPTSQWLHSGKIEFQDIVAQYR
jgi:ATP-binding cassette subfamily C (CFTR/MRP) protein 1